MLQKKTDTIFFKKNPIWQIPYRTKRRVQMKNPGRNGPASHSPEKIAIKQLRTTTILTDVRKKERSKDQIYVFSRWRWNMGKRWKGGP